MLTARPGPGGGVFVTHASTRARLNHFVMGYKWNEAAVADHHVVRNALEPLVCREAADHRRDADLRVLEHMLDTMENDAQDPLTVLCHTLEPPPPHREDVPQPAAAQHLPHDARLPRGRGRGGRVQELRRERPHRRATASSSTASPRARASASRRRCKRARARGPLRGRRVTAVRPARRPRPGPQQPGEVGHHGLGRELEAELVGERVAGQARLDQRDALAVVLAAGDELVGAEAAGGPRQPGLPRLAHLVGREHDDRVVRRPRDLVALAALRTR